MNKLATLPLMVTVFAMVGTMVELEPLHAEGPVRVMLRPGVEPEIVPLPEALGPQEPAPAPMNVEPKKESSRPDLALTPGDLPSAEEAAKRAADPRAATGALIVAPALKK